MNEKRLLATCPPAAESHMGRPNAAFARWELAAEAIAVKIRWFGLVFGCLVVNVGHAGDRHQAVLNAILALGAGFAVLDTAWSFRGQPLPKIDSAVAQKNDPPRV